MEFSKAMSIPNLTTILVIYLIYWVVFGRHPQGIWICFWRALGLAIPTFMGTIVGIVEIYHFMFLYFIFLVGQAPNPSFALFSIPLFLVLSLIIYLIFIGIYLLFLKILWENPPKWLKFRSLGTIFLGFMISVIATLPAAITYAPFMTAIPSSELIMNTLMSRGYEASDIVGGMFLIWFLFAVGCYHAEYKFQTWRTAKLRVKCKRYSTDD